MVHNVVIATLTFLSVQPHTGAAEKRPQASDILAVRENERSTAEIATSVSSLINRYCYAFRVDNTYVRVEPDIARNVRKEICDAAIRLNEEKQVLTVRKREGIGPAEPNAVFSELLSEESYQVTLRDLGTPMITTGRLARSVGRDIPYRSLVLSCAVPGCVEVFQGAGNFQESRRPEVSKRDRLVLILAASPAQAAVIGRELAILISPEHDDHTFCAHAVEFPCE